MADTPLAGRRVIVTRATEQAGSLAGRLRRLGAEPLHVPLIETVPLGDPTSVIAALHVLGGKGWLAFSSANGVRHAWPQVSAAWPDGVPAGVRIAAIGPGTARALRQRGARVDFVPPRFVAESAAETLPLDTGDPVLLLRADIARKTLPEALRARGAVVHDVPAYHTRPVEQPEVLRRALARLPDAVTFTSASTADGFARALGTTPWPESLKSVAIGPVTAAALEKHHLPVTAVARDYTLAGLLAALVHLYA